MVTVKHILEWPYNLTKSNIAKCTAVAVRVLRSAGTRCRSAPTVSRHLTEVGLPGRRLKAARVAISRGMKRKGNMWIRIFPQKSVTKKPLEVRMGKGKANVDHWVAVVKPATMLFEVEGVTETVAREALSSAAAKMPIRCRLAHRD